MTVAVRAATAADRGYVNTVLQDAGLPTAGLDADQVRLYLATADDDRVGVGGFEEYGAIGILRSIAIEPEHRGRGYGSALVDALEAECRAAGIESLALLTTDAAPFFEQLGYQPTVWSSLPAEPRDSTALTAVCPDSADCLEKRL